MLLLLAALLGIVWIFSFAVFHVTASALHLVLLLAVVAVVLYFLSKRTAGGHAT
jgi:hypothetical protein